jgi:hypothetical protein
VRRYAWRLAALALAVAPLAGCGKVGPPVAPELRLPAPVTDLTGVVVADGIELAWTNPSRRVDGTRLDRLAVARVFRAEDAGGGDPRPALLARGRIVGYREVATVALDTPEQAAQGDRTSVVDREALALGQRYTYVVVTEDAQGRVSPPSMRQSLTFLAAPEPPRDLAADPGEAEVRLGWMAPARLTDGTPVDAALMYEVLRSVSPETPLTPITPQPISATTFVDRELENERPYTYAVRAVRREAGTTARSATTPPVVATPVDMTAPSAPTNLVAVPSAGAVRLSWSASPEPDVATYVVYRAREGGAFTRLGSTKAPDTTFTDRDVTSGTYRYTVSAQDAGSRANESRRSGEATATVP